MLNPTIGYPKLGYGCHRKSTGASYEKAWQGKKSKTFGVFGCSFHVFRFICTKLRLDKLHTTTDTTGVPAKSAEPASGYKQLTAANSAATARPTSWAMVKHTPAAVSAYI